MPPQINLRTEIVYVILLFALFVVPKVLQRLRLPGAITSLALGALSGMGFGLFIHDATVQLLSSLGIVALFLFAGLEVDIDELRKEKRVLAQHIALRLMGLALVALVVAFLLGTEVRVAALVALALLTPSTGFILDSLATLGMSRQERFWIKSKAISLELVALLVLLFTLQSTTVSRLFYSVLALVLMIVILPWIFRTFAAHIAPFAPKSEFAFLLMLALLCAIATRELGVYYLVGAFVVGMAARRFRKRLPAIASERMLHAVEVFASFFVPFYFFHAGLTLEREDFRVPALITGIVFLVLFIPFRAGLTALHRRIALGESFAKSSRIAVSMLPTLVFTLVIALILKERFQVPQYIFGGLIIYTLGNTLIPGLLLHQPPPEFESPHLVALDDEAGDVESPAPVSEDV